MPRHDIPENPLSTSLDSITMTRDQPIKVPLINFIDRRIERRTII